MAETEYTERVVVIVESGQVDLANQQAEYIDPDGGEFAWTVGLSPTGEPPTTHYWNNWQMTPGQRTELSTRLDAIISGYYQWFDLDSWDPAIARPTPKEILQLSDPPLKVLELEL